jgi:hypothetical protein
MPRKNPVPRDPKKYAPAVEKDRPLFEWTLRDYKSKFVAKVAIAGKAILAAWK